MRKVLSNNQQVAHYFANDVQPEGSCSNFFFENNKLYSYGRHFCIARRLPSGVVVFTTRTYSSSTSKHLAYARSALRHLRLVYCHDPSESARANMQHARETIRDRLHASEKKGIRQTTRDALKGEALRIGEQANAYLAALPDDEKQGIEPIDLSNLEGVRAALVAAEEARKRIAEEQRQARMVELREALEKWRKGEILYRTGLHELPPALRLSGDGESVQTSHGAAIPVSDALQLWPLILSVKAGERTSEEAGRMIKRLGVYHLSEIRGDGSIRVGCHDIAFSEIEHIAVSLGLLVAA